VTAAVITLNEAANLPRTLSSVRWASEIIVVDSGSADRTVEIAKSFGAKVFVEEWKGYAAQKNSAIDKATCNWVLSLDADEEVSSRLAEDIAALLKTSSKPSGFFIPRKNMFLGRWIRHGGFWPDPKLRLFDRTSGRFEDRAVHETVAFRAMTAEMVTPLLHHSYPTLSDYIGHMNRYSSLGAEMVVAKGKVRFSFINIVLRPIFTFVYNYVFRLGFLDGREGLLLHLYHAVYVSWKYAKAWELSRSQKTAEHQ
jgi:glycosyltransferase involved in cell wall biosynthesis